jgi:hypothetical protein
MRCEFMRHAALDSLTRFENRSAKGVTALLKRSLGAYTHSSSRTSWPPGERRLGQLQCASDDVIFSLGGVSGWESKAARLIFRAATPRTPRRLTCCVTTCLHNMHH